MFSVGIDLHKHSITICVLDEARDVLCRQTIPCSNRDGIVKTFEALAPFQAAVEATASYYWLVELLEPLAQRIVLANPKKLRVIAESTRKTDRIDAYVLALFLAMGMIPQAYQATPRQRQHRALVRHRQYLQGQLTAVQTKIRRILSDYNADRRDLFTIAGLDYLAKCSLNDSDQLIIKQLTDQWHYLKIQLAALTKRLQQFAKQAPAAEAEARALVASIPGVGPVTTDVVISELGDVQRFSSAKKVCAYAGLVPIVRQSDRKRKELPITKAGSGLLRWALVQAAWRVVGQTRRWGATFARLKKRRGAKKAIVAIARRLLTVIYSILKQGRPYQLAAG
jgi:transposase